jgi:hypothetical protein
MVPFQEEDKIQAMNMNLFFSDIVKMMLACFLVYLTTLYQLCYIALTHRSII